MKWSKPLMMDDGDSGIDGCPVRPYSAYPCSPTVIKIYEVCIPGIIYYYV